MLHLPSYEMGKLLGAFDRERGINMDVETLCKGLIAIPEHPAILYPDDGTPGNSIPLLAMSMMEGYFHTNPNCKAHEEMMQ